MANFNFLKFRCGVAEMAQELRAVAVLSEEPVQVPAPTWQQLKTIPVPGELMLFLTST